MTWGLARFAAYLRRLVSRRPAQEKTAPLIGSHGHAENTAPMLKGSGADTLNDMLLLRGMRLHNRNRAMAERYAKMHRALAKGSCSDG